MNNAVNSVFRRRRADRFAQLLEAAGGLRRLHSRSHLDDELAPMVRLSQRVTRIDPAAEMDPDFRTGLRAMLVATAERDGIGITAVGGVPAQHRRGRTGNAGPRQRTGPRQVRTRGAIVIGIAAGTVALSGMSAASNDAVPGDALYGIKRSTEQAQLALASSDVNRGQLYLAFARTRIAEANAVRQDRSGLDSVLTDMDDETRLGVRLLNSAAVERRDPTALNLVDEFVADQQRATAELLDGLPAHSRARVLESRTLLESVARRTGALRTALNCGATQVGEDVLGPLPNTCQAAVRPNTGRPTGEQPETGTARDTERRGGTTQAGATGAPGDPVPTVAPSSTPSAVVQQVGVPSDTEDEGGLLADVGRLLGDLLGG